jgi:hypothetical protein
MERNSNQMARLQTPLAGLKYGKIVKHLSAKQDAKTTETSVAQTNTRQQKYQARRLFQGSAK